MIATSEGFPRQMGHAMSRPAERGDSELLRRLAACLAHHVNNALTGVIGHLELALLGVPLPSSVQVHLQASLSCAFQAAAAVRRIVTFAQRTPPPPASGSLSLAALAEHSAEQLRRKHLTNMTIAVHTECPGWVQASEPHLSAALEAILSNGVEAMPAGGLLQMHIWQHDGRCRLSILDRGPGIPAEIREHLFEPFVTTKFTTHLGLGLVLARDLVQSQGGSLELASSGEGTTVTLSFPQEEQPQHPEAEADTLHELEVHLP
jgi:signal transduction histidine kinase